MKVRRFFLSCLLVAALCAACTRSLPENGDGLDLRERVKKVVLDNGMTFLLLKRGQAPVFSVQMKVKVGTIEEEPGQSGLAHFFEHLAFKGTDKIGTKSFVQEKPILDEVLKLGTEIVRARQVGKAEAEIEKLVAKRRELEQKQNEWIEKNEFVSVFQRNGGADLNASTSNDFTTYYVSLPSNKLELWAYLESERLTNRVFREFFTEVDVVAEERRMRVDNSPDGKLYESFTNTAFRTSPYQVHPIGYARDIQNYTPEEAMAFYKKYYVPSRIVVAVVGNFDVHAVEKIIRKYFGKIPAGQGQNKVFAKEDLSPESFPRTVTLKEGSTRRFYLGFHRPAHPHPDDIVLDVVQSILCDGRTSRLYKRLVLEERKVAGISCMASLPGGRLDSVFAFYAVLLADHTSDEVEKIIFEEIDRLKAQGPTATELEIVKNQIDADLIYSLDSNEGLASALAFFESLTGDWKYIYRLQKGMHAVQGDDIKRVLTGYFVKDKKTAAYLEPK